MSEALTKAIVTAADEGRLEDVKAALAAGASPDAMGPNSSALHMASFNGHEEIVQLLLQHKANPNLLDKQSFYPLQLAASKGRDAICKLLIENGATIEAKTQHGGTALHVAAASDFPSTIQVLLDAGANKEATDTGGNTPLLTACGLARAKVANTLIDAGASTSVLSDGEETLLHKLARGIRSIRVKKWEISGEIEGRDRKYTIVNGMFSIEEGDWSKVLTVQEQRKCAKLDWGPKAHLPYLEACDLFANLVKDGRNIHALDSGLNSAFNLVCHTGEARLVRLMLKAKSKWELNNTVGATPLHMAAGSGRSDGLEALLKAIPKTKLAARINFQDEFGWTPLHYLADIGGDVSMVAMMLAHGADRNAASTKERGNGMPAGMRPMDVAKHWKDREMAALLLP